MRIAWIDSFSGISGDMFLGALVGAGVPVTLLSDALESLNIGAALEIVPVRRSGIEATKVNVSGPGLNAKPAEPAHAHDHENSHAHGHAHPNEHEHTHANGAQESHNHSHPTGRESHSHAHHHPHRGLKEIRAIISNAAISSAAKKCAIAMFEAVGAAEAKIHGVDIEKIHFHEVGAVDSIADIVCAAVGAEALGVDEWVASPLNVGSGTVRCAHGLMPVPAPATAELLKGIPSYSSDVDAELVTPTGAAIVRILARRFAAMPPMTIDAVGYGAGSRDFPSRPNVTRIVVGSAEDKKSEQSITLLEANIDDQNPQIVGYAIERALDSGALDAFITPVQMKKNRPGMLLTVLCRDEDARKLTDLLLAETSTLGVRQRRESRVTLERDWVNAATSWGNVRVKVGKRNGEVVNFAPEFEDCRSIAMKSGVPLKRVMSEAARQYEHQRKVSGS